jgi:CPA2 family monovalent cation:H+ antiporter-2
MSPMLAAQNVDLISTVAMGIAAALLCGFIARRVGLPAIVGYLLGGVLVGPSTPGFVANADAAFQFAELGVIFMLFGVGLHFSLKDLARVKNVAVPGAILQMALATAVGWVIAHELWGWSMGASLVLGLAISIASTVVLLRGLADRGLLNTSGGKVAVGWLVLEDLATVAILVLLPAVVSDPSAVAGEDGFDALGVTWALGKAVIFVALVLVVGVRALPWLLNQITRTRSRELFLLAVVTLAAGTAYGAYELFGVGFALGAFLAGVVMGGTSINHQIEAEIGPFRDIFAVLFFVSVGMQVDIGVIRDQLDKVIVLAVAIVVGKAVITLALAFLMPKSGRELAVVAGGLSQIGEFSFIVGQAGLTLALLDAEQYALILAAAVVSIAVNPAMYSMIPHFESLLLRLPYVGPRMRAAQPGFTDTDHEPTAHVVVVGYGRVGTQTAKVLRELDYDVIVVDLDAPSVERAENDGLLALFGDASNSDILTHAGLKNAEALVVTLPNHTSTELVVAAAHEVAPDLAIVARAGLIDGVQRLHDLGARHVINPELEGGLEIVRHTLFELDYPMSQLGPYVDAVRREAYQGRFDDDDEAADSMRVLDQLLTAVRGVDIVWHAVPESSPLAGTTLGSSRLRARTGASVVALVQDGELQLNPGIDTTFGSGDLIGLIGRSEELAAAGELLTTGAEPAKA